MLCAAQSGLVHDAAWYVDADGRLNVVELMTAFQSFFREHSEHWVERFQYKEAGPQLLLQAFCSASSTAVDALSENMA